MPARRVETAETHSPNLVEFHVGVAVTLYGLRVFAGANPCVRKIPPSHDGGRLSEKRVVIKSEQPATAVISSPAKSLLDFLVLDRLFLILQ